MITAARRFESEILRAGLAGEGSHFDTKTTGFLLHLVALVFDAGLPAQRRLVNIEPRCNIAPTATPNRAFLRGFPATQFTDFRLCGRSPILAAIFGALSPHPKIPFPAAGLRRVRWERIGRDTK